MIANEVKQEADHKTCQNKKLYNLKISLSVVRVTACGTYVPELSAFLSSKIKSSALPCPLYVNLAFHSQPTPDIQEKQRVICIYKLSRPATVSERCMMSSHDFAALMNTNSASVPLLALEELQLCVQKVLGSSQVDWSEYERVRDMLRKWRCESQESHLSQAYAWTVVPSLRDLTIFNQLGVPLFIDNYGQRRYMSEFTQFGASIQVPVDLDTPIVHVTHDQEKEQIFQLQAFVASNNKNIIPGIWFSPKYQLGPAPGKSVYGNWAFETTLRNLGVSGIRQGEIVSYKQEVNFILYASDTVPLSHPLMATADAVRSSQSCFAYPQVSIFVPSKFLPKQGQAFKQAVQGPFLIVHGDFCVKQKRRVIKYCPSLT